MFRVDGRSEGASASGFPRARFRGALPALALLLLLGAPTLLYPYGRDQAMFAYVGGLWRDGGLPYRDAWDVKLPAIYAAYAFLGGATWGPRLADLLLVGATALGLFRLAGGARRAGESAAPWAAAALVLYTLGALDYWNLAQAEIWIAALSTGSVVAAMDRRFFAAGLLAGLAALFKTTALLALAPAFVAVCSAGGLAEARNGAPGARRCSPAAALLAGFLLPLGATLLYFAARGGLPYLAELLAAQAEYAGGDPRLAVHPPWEVVRQLGLPGYLPLVAASGAGLALLLREKPCDGSRRALAVAAAWWLAALAQVAVQRRFYLYHWAVLTPPAAWLAAEAAARLWRRAGPVGRAGLLAAGLAAVALALAPRLPDWAAAVEVVAGRRSLRKYQRRFVGVFGYSVAEGQDAGMWLRAHAAPGERIAVFGFEPHVYLESGLRAPNRHASTAPIFGETSIREARRRAWFREWLTDLQRHPPRYWVEREQEAAAPLPAWATPLAAFRARYRLAARQGAFRLYRLERPEERRPSAFDSVPAGG